MNASLVVVCCWSDASLFAVEVRLIVDVDEAVVEMVDCVIVTQFSDQKVNDESEESMKV